MQKYSPIGIYIHWPFCVAKCPYCDFNSHVRRIVPDQKRFAQALVRELKEASEEVPGRIVQTIFFGGGTPSLMEGAIVNMILEAVARYWMLADHVEITLEANPSSVEIGRFLDYKAAGVNRLSLGIQALEEEALKSLGRLHNVREALGAITLAQKTFSRISFDLIYARPDQTLTSWREELTTALNFGMDHLSLYQLTIEPKTPYAYLHARGKLSMPDDEATLDFYNLTQDIMTSHGLPAYEISNHARRGSECQHNLLYWRYQEYIGIGPGAHSRLILGEYRYARSNKKHPETWLRDVETVGHARIENSPLLPEEEADELLLMGLRLREGIKLERYEALCGRPLKKELIVSLAEQDFLKIESGYLQATSKGVRILDHLLVQLAA